MEHSKNTDDNLLLQNELETQSRRDWLSFIISTSQIALFMSLNSVLFVLYPFFLYNFLSLSLDSATLAFAAIAAGDFSGRFIIGNNNTKVKENESATQMRLTILAILIAVVIVVIVMISELKFAALVMLSFLLGLCRGLMLMSYSVTHGDYFNCKTNPLAFAFASMIVAAAFVLLRPFLVQQNGGTG